MSESHQFSCVLEEFLDVSCALKPLKPTETKFALREATAMSAMLQTFADICRLRHRCAFRPLSCAAARQRELGTSLSCIKFVGLGGLQGLRGEVSWEWRDVEQCREAQTEDD